LWPAVGSSTLHSMTTLPPPALPCTSQDEERHDAVGVRVGVAEGTAVGVVEGAPVGVIVGAAVGPAVGVAGHASGRVPKLTPVLSVKNSTLYTYSYC
jgi:hypothetical protein